MEKNAKHRFSGMHSLRVKLMVAFILVSFVATAIVGALSVNNIYIFSQREVERTSAANLHGACEALLEELQTLRLELIRPEVYQLAVPAVTDLLIKGETDYEKNSQLMQLMSTTRGTSGVHSMYYMNEERVVTYIRENRMDWGFFEDMPWFSEWYESGSRYMWGKTYTYGGANLVPYVRKLYLNGEVVGVGVLNVYERQLADCWSGYGNIVVLDGRSTVMSARDKQALGKSFSEAYGVSLDGRASGESFTVTHGGVQYTAVLYRDVTYGVAMVELLPFSSTRMVMTDMLMSTLVLVAGAMLICVLLSTLLSAGITKPLKNARDKVDKLQLDALSSDIPVESNDEIGMLVASINDMTQRLENSRREIISISEERRLAEYRAIQLQINPHFLYNTLSSISWFTDLNQPDNVKRVTESLSTLFRISVNHGREMLRISEEIKHARCYLDIQMLRHRDEFTYQIDVDPEILDYYTIKIILQPLVENAIYHGIRENGVAQGFIRIVGRRVGEDIVLEVIDNGDIPQERIDRMNEIIRDVNVREDVGIGMLNVHNRIRYYYQGGYGLCYEKRGAQTVARIVIPVREENGEDGI